MTRSAATPQTRSAASSASDLRFGDDAELGARVREELAETLSGGDAERRNALLSALVGRNFHAESAADLAELGLDSHDLAGAMAAYWIVMWTVVHDAELPGTAMAGAVHRQIARMISTSPLVRDPAQRQLMGEAMVVETMLAREAQRVARAEGDSAKLKAMAESAQRNMLTRQAVNLKKMRFTVSGLVRS